MKALLITLALAAALLIPTSAQGLARNNNGATLDISPSQPTVGDSVTFSGCNYIPGIGFTITVQAGNKTGAEVFVTSVITDPFGCLITTDPFVPDPGTYYAAAWFANGHRVSFLNFSVTG